LKICFDWDPARALGSVEKHGISFAEASTVFDDPLAAIFADEFHFTDEYQKIIIGHSLSGQLLLVCFTERDESIMRIFSVRKDYSSRAKRLSRKLQFLNRALRQMTKCCLNTSLITVNLARTGLPQ
jgi:hypothetical protein